MIAVIISALVLFSGGVEPIEEIREPIEIELGGQEDIYENMKVKFDELVKETLEKRKEAEEAEKLKEAVKPVIKKDCSFDALVLATFNLETGYGSSWLWKNYYNAGGIKCGTEYCKDTSEYNGMQRLRVLLQRYVDRYGYDFEAIRSVYSESDDTALFTNLYYKALAQLEG